METFYITTPIYYPNDKLHIGHSYTTVAADALARYHRKKGETVFFLTGTDEHGQKIERKAHALGKEPLAYVDGIVEGIQELWKELGISYDDFIRTSEARHHHAVQEVFRRLEDNGDLYKADYEGWYCTPCETFWTEAKLENGACPVCGGPVERLREESYFFKLSRYEKRLIDHIESHPEFIQPVSRRNEMLAFLHQGLEDLSVSRTSFRWGIPLPRDARHIAYVWVDALTNYLTAIGFPDDMKRFEAFWPADLHLVGKEIVRFHTIIWPIMLMALDLPLPRHVYGHGWLLLGQEKMSKSKGNVVDPASLIRRYGVDPVRYYLLREVPFGSDGSYTEDALVLRTNVDLANDLGNLLSRTTAMIGRFCEGAVPRPQSDSASGLRTVAEEVIAEAAAAMDSFAISDALMAIWRLVGKANKYIEDTAPWDLAKRGDPRLGTVLYDLAESLRILAVALTPFLLDSPRGIYAQLGFDEDPHDLPWTATAWGGTKAGQRIARGHALFPRIDAGSSAKEDDKGMTPLKPEITIEDFTKIDLRIVTVEHAEKVAGADRLLKLDVRLGEQTRTVVSGIAEHVSPETLVGKQLILVANLKAARLRGVESRGMILAASEEGALSLVVPEKPMAPGSLVK